jgi:hypothetical protein
LVMKAYSRKALIEMKASVYSAVFLLLGHSISWRTDCIVNILMNRIKKEGNENHQYCQYHLLKNKYHRTKNKCSMRSYRFQARNEATGNWTNWQRPFPGQPEIVTVFSYHYRWPVRYSFMYVTLSSFTNCTQENVSWKA